MTQTRRGPLENVGWLLVALSVAFGAALILDPRTIDGAPAWLLRFLPDRTTLRRIAGTATAAVFVIEVALIALQAARGTISHFNTRSVFDGAVFSVMGHVHCGADVDRRGRGWGAARATSTARRLGKLPGVRPDGRCLGNTRVDTLA